MQRRFHVDMPVGVYNDETKKNDFHTCARTCAQCPTSGFIRHPCVMVRYPYMPRLSGPANQPNVLLHQLRSNLSSSRYSCYPHRCAYFRPHAPNIDPGLVILLDEQWLTGRCEREYCERRSLAREPDPDKACVIPTELEYGVHNLLK